MFSRSRIVKLISLLIFLAVPLLFTSVSTSWAQKSIPFSSTYGQKTEQSPDWTLYNDPVNGYSLFFPSNWMVEPTPSEGVGSVATFTDEQAKTQITVGITHYDRPENVSLKDWVVPHISFSEFLVEQEDLEINGKLVILQKFLNDSWSSQIAYLPFDSKVMFIQISPDSDENRADFLHLVKSINYPTHSHIASTIKDRLYPVVTEPTFRALAEVEYILPFSGKAKITQTGDDGLSHNCPGVNCEALDFTIHGNNMDGRVYAAAPGTVVFHGWNPSGFGNTMVVPKVKTKNQ